jgi:hypothetical protein
MDSNREKGENSTWIKEKREKMTKFNTKRTSGHENRLSLQKISHDVSQHSEHTNTSQSILPYPSDGGRGPPP